MNDAAADGEPGTRDTRSPGDTMRAVVLEREGDPDVLTVQDVPVPQPGPGEVRVALAYASLNRLDLWIRRGQPSVPKPRIMGADGAGTVDVAGDGVDGWTTGERVLVDPSITCGTCRACVTGQTVLCEHFSVLGEHRAGTHAEYVVVPAANLHRVPEHLDDRQAAALPLVFATAWRMLTTRAQVRPEERVLIWGASAGVGSAALLLARAMGLETIVTSRSAQKLKRLADLGATHLIDSSGEDVVARVKQLTGGRGVEVVFDHLGEASYEPSLRALARGGRYVTCGVTTGANPPASLSRLFWRQLTVMGSTMADKRDVAAMVRFVTHNQITPPIAAEFGLDEVVAAHTLLEGSEQVGKVVLRVGR